MTICRSWIRRTAWPPPGRRELDLRGCRGDAVVVGEEPLGVGQERVADAAVDRALCLQERTHVQLEQPGAVLAVERRQGAAGQDREEDGEVPVGVGRGQAGQRLVELDDDRLAEGAGARHPVEPGEVPDLVADRQAVEAGVGQRRDGGDAVGEQEEPEPRRLRERLFHGEAHVIDIGGFLDVAPQSVAAALDERRRAAQQRLGLGPARHSPVPRKSTSRAGELNVHMKRPVKPLQLLCLVPACVALVWATLPWGVGACLAEPIP